MTKPKLIPEILIPRKLKIGGRIYKVFYPHRFKDSLSPHYGLHDAGGQTIKISQIDEYAAERNPESIIHTFIHETLHAIDCVYNGGRLTAWEKGEETIDQLAEGILQMFKDNKINWRLK